MEVRTLQSSNGSPLPLNSAKWIDDIVETDHVRFFKSTNWDETPLGPIDQWPNALRLYTHQVLSDSRPAIIYWYEKLSQSPARLD